MYIVQFILQAHAVYCILYSVYCRPTLYTVYCTVYSAGPRCILYIVQCILQANAVYWDNLLESRGGIMVNGAPREFSESSQCTP